MTDTELEPGVGFPSTSAGRSHIAIIGTGFSGLGMAIKLKEAGINDFVILERSDDVGGTWRDNSYPGCQCDVPSHLYSFSFRLNPDWSRTYSHRSEIWAYLRDCAEDSGLLPHVLFGRAVTSARWDEERSVWELETGEGTWTADILIAGYGGLAEPAVPAIEGINDFEGKIMHSAAWDHDVDLVGKRVAVVGTGASAIQIVPRIQPQVAHVDVYQRTPAWILPHTDRPITDRERRIYRRFPLLQKLLRRAIYLARELLVIGMTRDRRFLAPIQALAKRHLRHQVSDPALRRMLTPRYSLGCKRILLSNDFYPAVASDNCELVTDGIKEIGNTYIVTGNGERRDADVVVFATGFRVTDNPMAAAIHGRSGISLAEKWERSGMGAYLGSTVDDFPNLFLLTGPNTGIGHTSLVVMIEAQIELVLGCLRFMDRGGVDSIEVRPAVLDGFNREIQTRMKSSVWTMGGCASWYLDDKGNNPTLWPDFTWRFRKLARRFDPTDYVFRTKEVRDTSVADRAARARNTVPR